MKEVLQNILIWLTCMLIIYVVVSFISWDYKAVIRTEDARAGFILFGGVVSGLITWLIRDIIFD